MKFLITNDDGVEAPGIAALASAARKIGDAVVVAPEDHLSGCSHRVNLFRALELRELESNRYALDGTPADCTRVGLWDVAADADWVLSGVNDGGNLGVDVYMSGTVAAVREAALLGKAGIAFSQYRRDAVDWDNVIPTVNRVLDLLLKRPPRPGAFWNVNLPDTQRRDQSKEPEMVFCGVDLNGLQLNYEKEGTAYLHAAVYNNRPREAGADVDVCFSGNIAISEVLPTRTGRHEN